MSEALTRANEKLKEMRSAGIEPERLDPIEKATRNTASKALAIVAMCYECVGRNADPNYRKEVAHCTSWGCSLWHLRPWQELAPPNYGHEKRAAAVADYPKKSAAAFATANPESRVRAIRAKCVECMGNTRIPCPSDFPRERAGLGGYRGCPLWPHRPVSQR